MKITYRDGLLFTSLILEYKGKTKEIHNIVIDTGAAETILSPDAVEEIGIYAEMGDRIVSYTGVGGSIHTSFVKTIDSIYIENKALEKFDIDFGIIDPKGEINGLLGLDILMVMESL